MLGLITARIGSKGIPLKNIKTFLGKPLIAWSIEQALQSRLIDRVVVSTDDEKIANISRKFGAEVPFIRPVELARDNSPHLDVVLHAVNWLENNQKYSCDHVCLLQPTSPLRQTIDIDGAIELALKKNADSVVSVCEANQHPYFCKQMQADGNLVPFVQHNIAYARRQDIPVAYFVNGAVYVNNVTSLKTSRSFTPKSCVGFVMPQKRSIQIDTPWDFELAEMIFKSQNVSL